jgi:hypothetical protein
MITLIQEPSALGFAQHPQFYRLRATHDDGRSFVGRGMSQSIALVEVDDVLPGANINISVTEVGSAPYSILFDIVATPTHDQHLPIYEQDPNPPRPVGSFEGYYQDIAHRMSRAHLLSPTLQVFFNYDAVNHISTISFVARDNATVFEIEVESLSNATVLAVVPAIASSKLPNYAIVYEVVSEASYKTGIFHSEFRGVVNPSDVDGMANVNLQNILTAFADSSRWTPPNCIAPVAHRANNLLRYYCRFAEKYGSPVVQHSWTPPKIKTILRGGGYAFYPLLGRLNADSSLFNTLPDDREVAQNSPEFLSWFNYTGVFQSLKVEWRTWSRNDGLMTMGINANISLYADQNETLMVPALIFHDYQEVSAAVEVRLLNQVDEAVCPWRRYAIDRRFHENERYLMFLNKYGVFESMRFTGALTVGVELDRRESQRYTDGMVEVFELEKRWRRSFTYRTGYLSKSESLALENLVASRYVFEVSTTEGYIPLRILDTKISLDDGKQEVYSLEIKAAPQLDYYGVVASDLWLKW